VKKLKVLSVLGTRPEVIKLAPVFNEFFRQRGEILSCVVFTGQHQDMATVLLRQFGITPQYNLKIMRRNQSLADIVSRSVSRLSRIIVREKPHCVMVQGDTSTAFIAGLCAYYHKIPLAHVEAGLRTFDKNNPFPEEIHRRFISLLADFHFAPTPRAARNLAAEGIVKKSIYVTGNTVIDSLRVLESQSGTRKLPCFLTREVLSKKIILVTIHRRESFGQPLREVCTAIDRIARLPEVEVVFPVHRNPQVRTQVRRLLRPRSNLHLVEPLEYKAFIDVMKHSYLVLTDSGGVQEEAPVFGKPVLVLRQISERPEGLDAGVSCLVERKAAAIVGCVRHLLDSPAAYKRMSRSRSLYGDGRAAERITAVLLRHKTMLQRKRNEKGKNMMPQVPEVSMSIVNNSNSMIRAETGSTV